MTTHAVPPPPPKLSPPGRRAPARGHRLLFASVALLLAAVGALTTAAGATAKPRASAPHSGNVVVSLTFDDGAADQLGAANILDRNGQHGTFYLNSGRLNTSGYMSTQDAQSLQARGEEIGGHTVSHADLPTLTNDEAQRQICTDRVNLLNAGLQVRNLAYPYGDFNATTENLARQCGYNSARGVGGIASSAGCRGCPTAETIPPADPYAIATPDSVKSSTSLQSMQDSVTQAGANGGGWVVFVIHHLCDGCDVYSVSPTQLEAFSSWLNSRAANGVSVATVGDVIGGAVKPGVQGPVAAPASENGNLLQNPSMETINSVTGAPTCWQRAGYGANTYSWANTSTAQEGSMAERMDISWFSDGDRRLISSLDLGACAPPTTVGHTYQLSGWYQSQGTVRMVAYSRNSAGNWTFLGQGPLLPATTTYTKATWTTPAMPADSTAISVGYSLRSVGFLVGDNMSLRDTDQTPPTAAVTSPADGSDVTGTVTINATASDASGVDHVDFLVNGQVACVARTAPYTCSYDTTKRSDSVLAVTARAVDTAGNVGLSPGVNYFVKN